MKQILNPEADKLREVQTLNNAQKLVNESWEAYKQKPYVVENSGLFYIAKIAGIFGGVLSVLAAVLFLTNLLLQVVTGNDLTTSSTGAAVALGVLAGGLLLLVEVLKSKLCAGVIRDWYRGGGVSVGAAVVLAVVLGVSGFTSIQGAAELAKMQAQIKPENLTDVGAVAADYTEQIKTLQGQIRDAKKPGSGYTWNGALTDKGRKYTENLQGQISKLTDLREGAKVQAENKNNALTMEATNRGTYNAGLVMLFAGLIELLILGAVTYQERYKYTVFCELQLSEPDTRNGARNGSTSSTGAADGTGTGAGAAGIGFKTGSSHQDKKPGYEIKCKNCNQVKIMKSPNAIFCGQICRVDYYEKQTGRKLTVPK